MLGMGCRMLLSFQNKNKRKEKKKNISITESCKGCRLVPGNISGLSGISKFWVLNTSKDGAC